MKNKQKTSKPLPSKFPINIPTNGNKLLESALQIVNSNDEIKTLWKVINVNATERLGMTDHGPVHFQIVSNIALRFIRILINNKVKPSVVKDFGLTNEHAELIIFLGSLLHDTGMSINRDGHEEFSLFITNTILREILDFLPIEERTIVISETLHTIINHRSGGHPITLEGGILRVADALDMSEGRSRIPFEAGHVDIYSVSSHAIDNVTIAAGKKKFIIVNIFMNNSAGIYQIDQLLRKKLKKSGLEKYVQVKAYINTENEKKLMSEYEL